MTLSSYDLKAFYYTRLGRVARRIINQRIAEIWSNCNGDRVMGTGYATPFLQQFSSSSERCFAIMPENAGAHHWPLGNDSKNLSALCDSARLPIETNSIDRVLMIHDLEHCDDISATLSEIWRVLKSNGRALVIVPNRSGFWARSDKTPFGQGRPFSNFQLCNLLRDHQFVHERTAEALFMPTSAYPPFLKLANTFETIGKTAFPLLAGVHMVEVSKQVYARADRGSGSAIVTGAKRGIIPRPVTSSKISS